MPINLSTEPLITLTEARRLFPGDPHPSTIWRWYLRGCRGRRLETVVVGGRRFTSAAAIERFIAATTEARTDGTPATQAIVTTDRRRALALADATLARAGI